jgi:hypothetical protein
VSSKAATPYWLHCVALRFDLNRLYHILHHEKDANAFGNDIAKALVVFAWNGRVRKSFLFKFYTHLISLAIVVALSLLVSPKEDDTLGSVTTDNQYAGWALCFALVPYLVYTLWHEGVQMTRDRKTHFLRCLGETGQSSFAIQFDYFKDFWNLMDLVRAAFMLAFIITYFASNRHYQWLLSILSYLMWFGILYFLQAFGATSSLVRMILQICIDIRWFLIVLCLCILGTGNAFYVLLHHQSESDDFFGNVARTLFSMFNMLLLNNSYDLGMMAVGRYNVLVRVIFVASMVFVSIILLNLLIGLLFT